MKTLIATRTTTNPAWTKTLTIKLVSTSNGYWWQGVAPEGAAKDAATDAHALRPGKNRKAGYSTVVAACRQATKEGWNITPTTRRTATANNKHKTEEDEMKKANVYEIKTAGNLDGETIIAYTHAAALKAARRHAGTQRGGIKTTVRLSHVCADASDLDLAYLDARHL